MPKEYGITKDKKGLLPWSHVEERMEKAAHYWICAVTPDGRPHAVPVDGLWLDGALYFGGSPKTQWQRYLRANPAVSVHLESTTDVVMLRGRVERLVKPARSLTEELAEASTKKYGFALKPEQYESGDVCIFRPRLALAWKNFPKDATRWQFKDPSAR